MLELNTNKVLQMNESKYPKFREIFSDLARDYDFPIYWYEEDNSGEIQINIHHNFIEDLKDIINDNTYEYNNELKELIFLIESNPDLSVFYYN